MHITATTLVAFRDELEKIAITRSVEELRNAISARNERYEDEIAQKSRQAGLSQRYVNNSSGGGMEAAVDRMVGASFGDPKAPVDPMANLHAAAPVNPDAPLHVTPRYSTPEIRRPIPKMNPSPELQARLADYKSTQQLPASSPVAAQAPQVDLHPERSGHIARRLDKLDSPVAVGQAMTDLNEMKLDYNRTARDISPAARSMTPEMYGHQQLRHADGSITNISEGEFVRGIKDIETSANPTAHVARYQKEVLNPMAALGKPMADTGRIYVNPETGQKQLAGNLSNIVMTPKGPKGIDFLPQHFGTGAVAQTGQHDIAYIASGGSGKMDTIYGDHNTNQLRRGIYRGESAIAPAAPAGQFQSYAPRTNTAVTTVEAAKPAAAPIAKTLASPIAKPAATAVSGIKPTITAPKAPPRVPRVGNFRVPNVHL